MTHEASRRLLGIALIWVGLAGCGRIRADQARDDYLRDATRQYRYDMRCEELWSDVRNLVFDEGYSVQTSEQTGTDLTLETEWKIEDEGFDDEPEERSRYFVQATESEPGQCRVRFKRREQRRREDDGNDEWDDDEWRNDRNDDAWGYSDTSRDWRMEWRLIQRVAPADAERIEREAERAADDAR